MDGDNRGMERLFLFTQLLAYDSKLPEHQGGVREDDGPRRYNMTMSALLHTVQVEIPTARNSSRIGLYGAHGRIV